MHAIGPAGLDGFGHSFTAYPTSRPPNNASAQTIDCTNVPDAGNRSIEDVGRASGYPQIAPSSFRTLQRDGAEADEFGRFRDVRGLRKKSLPGKAESSVI